MEYFVIRIYRREPGGEQSGQPATSLTGLVEDSAGRKEPFHSAEQLWQVLVDAPPLALAQGKVGGNE